MKNIVAIILLLIATGCVAQFAPHNHYWGVIIGPNGDVLDTVKVEGITMQFYNNGNLYTAGVASPDTLYNITFRDAIDGGFYTTLKGSLVKCTIDRQSAGYQKGVGSYRNRITYLAGADSAVVVDGIGTPSKFLTDVRVDRTGEIHNVLSTDGDTIFIDGVWAEDGTNDYADFQWFIMMYLVSDSLKYGTETFGNVPGVTVHNRLRAHTRYLNNHNVMSKAGGMIWRHDNWLSQWNSHQTSLASWHSVLDKYGIKATSALNDQYEERWTGDYEKYAKFWRSIQARGHEVASHGPQHLNHMYIVTPANRKVTADMPGVLSIKSGPTFDTVYLDTIARGFRGISKPLVTNAGFDIWLKRSKDLFADIGLNQPTYWVEGGGLDVYFNPDSIYDASWDNNYIGGGKYVNSFYQHMGFNTPWRGKSEYFMNWNSPEAISLTTDGTGEGPRNYTALKAIKKIVDQSAKHTLTIFRQHIQFNLPSDWYLECMDSICEFSVRYPYYIRNWTGSEAARVVYQSETNPYINYIPSLDVNIDEELGDTMPDGWTIGATAAYWEAMTGSQGSLGCVSVNTGETTNLYLTRLYGIEKGINTFTIDVKDKGANDTVYVEFTYSYGDTYSGLSTAEINKAFPSTASWATNETEVIFPYNTSFVDIQIWSRTDESYVDELTLRKKY